MKTIKNVSFVGMGALGLLYGSHIIKSKGRDFVTYVMDERRVEKARNSIFEVNGERQDLQCIRISEAKPADLLILAVKYTGLESAFDAMAPCSGPDTIILSVMNGISSEDMIAERFHRPYMIYTVPQGMDAMKFGTSLRYTQMGKLHIGITDPAAAEDLEAVCAFFEEVSMPYVREEDILWRMWFKYMLNVGVNQACMVFDTSYSGVTGEGEPHDVMVEAMREVVQIAGKKGISLTEQDIQTCIDIEKTLDPKGVPSMAQDRINKKPSEADMFAGTVMRLGREYGIPTPANEWLYRRVKEIEKDYVQEEGKAMRKYDAVAMGELLIDFTDAGISVQGNPMMEANPGGAPGNVMSMLSRLGHRTGFIGKVGNDMFGRQLIEALKEVGIGTEGIRLDPEIGTTLAFVHTLPGGDREFSFYRKPGADMMLRAEELDEKMLADCRIFHFGTLSMTDEPCRTATRLATEIAKKSGAILSFDPNLRASLWTDLEEAREFVHYGMGLCDIMKISDNEVEWLTGETDYDKGAAWILNRYHIPLLLVSLGPRGSRAYMADKRVEVPAVLTRNTVETTGAGDTFGACILHYVLEHDFRDYTEEELTEMLRFANAAASIVTTRKGALRVMPTREEVEEQVRKAF